ncbi:MAG: hypothetical protein ACRD9S_21620 [Pyrinomonadaceae bacterium]
MQTNIYKYVFAIVLTVGVVAFGAMQTANGQAKSEPKAVTQPRSSQSGRDPFKKYEPPRLVMKKGGTLVAVPSIQERIAQYKAQKLSAMNARVAAPKPTTAFLLGEIQVVGISRTPRGYAAIVEAKPIKLSYVIYPGERFYDGQLVAIEDSRLVFRRETVYSDGKRDRSVEMKPLRQANAVDAFSAAAAKPAASEAAPAEQESKSEKATPEKP